MCPWVKLTGLETETARERKIERKRRSWREGRWRALLKRDGAYKSLIWERTQSGLVLGILCVRGTIEFKRKFVNRSEIHVFGGLARKAEVLNDEDGRGGRGDGWGLGCEG